MRSGAVILDANVKTVGETFSVVCHYLRKVVLAMEIVQ